MPIMLHTSVAYSVPNAPVRCKQLLTTGNIGRIYIWRVARK